MILGPAYAQQPGGALLSAPSLPGTVPGLPPALPGGAAIPSLPGGAQQDILQRLLDAGAVAPGGTPGQPQPSPMTPPAAALAPQPPVARPAQPDEPLSPAEAFFAARLPVTPPLRQFGYDSFRSTIPGATTGVGFGAVPEDYVLGRDDEVVLNFRGRARHSVSARVNREGQLILPDMQPVPAAGRTLRDVRDDLSARTARDFPGSEVFVSIGQLRQVAVFVGGEVARPGMVVLSPLATVLDALMSAGGPRRTGSLRAIRVGNRSVDLYPVIAGEGGPQPDLRILEGERILVPPVGALVAIGGEVSRPGIYELPARAATQPLNTMLSLAGEALRPSGNRFLLETTDSEGRRSFREMAARDALRRGDALMVQPGVDAQAGGLRLSGHVGTPLTRASAGRGASLRGLISDPRMVRPDPYIRMGLIWRAEARTRVRRLMPFDLGRLLAGGPDVRLQEGDEVILLGLSDVQWLASPAVQRALRGEGVATASPAGAPTGTPAGAPLGAPAPAAAPMDGECPALTQLVVAARSAPQRFAHARAAGFPDYGTTPCPQIFIDYPNLLAFLLDQSVLLLGEVRLPGLYPVMDGTSMEAVLEAAGQVTDTADLASIELSREPAEQTGSIPLNRTTLDLVSRNFAAVRLSPRDALRIPRGFTDREVGPVTVMGEFLRPGVYDIRRGERLSELIARAGGLTPQAYPYGAILTRESVRQRQQDGFDRTARELEQGLMQVAAGQAVAGTRAGTSDIGGAISAGREMATALRQARAAGRLVVEANPVVLAGRPELDVLLEPGDLIVMPKRPNEVTVVGSVLNPGSLQFTTGWRAERYVRAAGGPQRFADASRAFIVLPNGTSVPAGLGAWQAGGPPVPPGSVLVVPQDPSPYENWGILRDLTSVFGQVAISAAALAVISRQGR
ncbi:polysaccharide biosynthesis/export protein [Rhodovarius crocodyli]|uniref:Polysaccharide biosynthesis/export protein n=1 Tax=Rhodovarius crocodyli TaxID=1979269 RepID=A0A437MG97_9PROT|nr:polysaccharide biosynthesis/export protein [Rhodovarius crocodyli]